MTTTPPLSPARSIGDIVYTAGHCGIDPSTGEAYVDFESEVDAAIRNLAEALEGEGSSLAEVVRTTVYLTDPGLFAAMNTVYVTYFSAPFPARATLVVGLALPSLRFEIDAIAGKSQSLPADDAH